MWNAVASASSRFRPPLPFPFTVTVVSPPKSVTSRRCGAAGPADEVPGAGPGDREPPGGRAGLPGEELGEDADVGAEPERLVPGPLEGGPDVAEEDAPALPAVPRAVLGVRREEVGPDGGGNEREEPVVLEDRDGVAPRGGTPSVGPGGDEVPAGVAEVREDERDDVGGARRGREAARP